MPRKAKRSKKRLSHGISNSMPHASSQGHSISVEPPLLPSNSAQPYASTITQIPSTIPITQNLASPSDPQLHEMPHKTKRLNKRGRHVTSNMISHASSQVHSAPLEPSLQHSKVAQPRTSIITVIPPSIPTTQNMVSPSDPPSRMPRKIKVKHSKKTVTFGISNLMPHASAQGHSIPVKPPLQPSELAQTSAPTGTLVPPSIPIVQDPVSLSDAPSPKPRKAKYSNKRVCRGISNLMPHASSQGHSTPVEPKPSTTAQSPSIPTAQNLVSPSDAPSSMPRKPKLSRERASLGISNFMPHASSHGHSTNVETLQQYYQSRAPATALIPPSIPTAQNVVPPSDPPLRGKPRRGKLSRERASLGISNLMPDVSSDAHSRHAVEPLLQLSQVAQSCAPTTTLFPPSIPTAQNLVSPSDPPLHAKPHRGKLSRERASLGISNLMPDVSSHGHYTHVAEPLRQPPQVGQSCAPTTALVPPSIPTAQNLVSVLDPSLHAKPRKGKLSRERASLGISNLLPNVASHGHCTHVAKPLLQPSQVAQSCALTSILVPQSIPTAQNLVSPSDPSLHAMPRKAKHSKKRGFHTHASPQGHSTHVQPPLPPSELAQSCAPTVAHIPSSVPTALDPLAPSEPPLPMPIQNIFSGILNLMRHAFNQGHSIPLESPPQPSKPSQPCAPTITDIPTSIPTAEDMISPSDLPSCLRPRKSKRSKKRVSPGISNLMSHASSQGHSIPMERIVQPLKKPCAPPVALIPSSIPTTQDQVSGSPSDSSQGPVSGSPSRGKSNLMHHASSQGHSIPLEPLQQPLELEQPRAPPVIPSSIPTAQDPVSGSPSNPSQDQVSGSPSDPSQDPVSGSLSDPSQDQVSGSPSDSSQDQVSVSPSDPSFVPPSTLTQQLLAPKFRPRTGRQWTVQAIDEHGNTKEIQVTKPGVFRMPPGQRIVVPFDRQLRAFGEAATLLSSACGRIATDSKNIPINFDSWPKVPKSYKDDCFNILKTLFHFQASDSIAKRYCLLTMSRKYRNGKLDLWTRAFDPSLSREQLIAKVPDGIAKDQWLSFVDNHLKPEYQELCRKNAELRKKQTTPHTGGSKLLSRKQHEMEVELGRTVGRVELFIATHTKKDGSFVNEEARSIGEKLTQEISNCANSTEISIDDALAKVLGQDHSGRVRCLGLGGLHSVAFQSTNAGFSGIGSKLLVDAAESSQLKEEVLSLKSKLAASEENVKTLQSIMLSYIQMKEGRIPAELGVLIEAPNQADEPGKQDMLTSKSGSSSASNDR